MNETQSKKDNSKKGLIIGFIVILLAINGIQYYFRLQDKEKLEKVEAVSTQRTAELNTAATSIDSLKSQLEIRYQEIAKLGGDTASLGQSIRALNVELNKAKKNANYNRSELNKLKKDYGLLLTQKDEEITQLKEQNEILYRENSGLKTAIVQREDSINRLASNRNDLAQKVAIASVLKVENLKTSVIDSRGKEHDDNDNEFRARRIDKVKVSFSIAENKVAKIETKDVYMRLLEPDGSTLHDAATGSGSFEAEGQQMQYTSKQSFLFDNRNPALTFVWGKGSEFNKGRHVVELYVDGYKIGEDSFTVK